MTLQLVENKGLCRIPLMTYTCVAYRMDEKPGAASSYRLSTLLSPPHCAISPQEEVQKHKDGPPPPPQVPGVDANALAVLHTQLNADLQVRRPRVCIC